MSLVLSEEIWTVLSNMAFLFPAVYLFITNLYVEAFVYFNVTIWSSLYHLCYNCGYCIVADREILQFMDFFSSYLGVAIILIYFIDVYPRKYKVILQCFGAIIVLFLANVDYFRVTNFIITLSLFIPVGIIHFSIYLLKWLRDNNYLKKMFQSCLCSNPIVTFIYNNRHSPFHPLDLISWLFGTIIFVIGFALNSFVPNPYWVTHSIWHVTSGIGTMFIFTLYNKNNCLSSCFKEIKNSLKSRNIENEQNSNSDSNV
jgi:hypothetical protein